MSCNKNTYTKKEAQAILNRLVKSGRWNQKHKGRIYECEICNGWHLTHSADHKPASDMNYNLQFKNKWKKLLKM